MRHQLEDPPSGAAHAVPNPAAKPCALFVGTFLSGSLGYRSVCEDLADRLEAAGWRVRRTSRAVGRFRRVADMLGSALDRKEDYDLAQVDVYSGPAFGWAEAICWTLRKRGKPYVLTLHGGALPSFARRWPGRVRRLLRTASAVTVPSEYLLERMRAYRSDLRLVPNPLDVNAYSFRLRSRPSPRLVWLRGFHRIYNPAIVPQVVSQLVPDFPDIEIQMIGPDKRDGSLQATRRAAAELGVLGRFHFTGGIKKSEVSSYLARSDIFLNTTGVDNTPVTVLEALASGLCIVSTNAGGLPYLLTNERDALLAPPGDACAMARAVRRILTEPGLAEELSRRARERAKSFDWTVVLPQWESLLSGLLPRGIG